MSSEKEEADRRDLRPHRLLRTIVIISPVPTAVEGIKDRFQRLRRRQRGSRGVKTASEGRAAAREAAKTVTIFW